MEQHEQLLVWSDDAGLIDGILRDRAAEQAPLLVADSWLMSDGRVRALDLHAARFAAGCAEAGCIPAEMVARFWAAVVHRLPDEGEWFPRVELASVPLGRLALRIRSAPQRTQSVRVWLPSTADPRQTPRRKGSDLGVLADLRQAAIAAGANEALLRTAEGVVLEGATTNLLWWEDDALCAPSPTLPVLPGVTSRLIQDEAVDRGIEVRHVRCGVEALMGREVWFVNALHGIRPVTAWIGADLRPGATTRSGAWRAWLNELPEPIDAARVVIFSRGDSRTRS